jgi:hypothetical protein
MKQSYLRLLDSCLKKLTTGMHSLFAEHRLEFALDAQFVFKPVEGNNLMGDREPVVESWRARVSGSNVVLPIFTFPGIEEFVKIYT